MLDKLGQHYIVELFGCSEEQINNSKKIEADMLEAARRANATIVTSDFHYFMPYGVSGAVIIEESHLTVHTWPEHGYAAIDIYTCGDINEDAALEYLEEQFQAKKVTVQKLNRGLMSEINKYKRKPNE